MYIVVPQYLIRSIMILAVNHTICTLPRQPIGATDLFDRRRRLMIDWETYLAAS